MQVVEVCYQHITGRKITKSRVRSSLAITKTAGAVVTGTSSLAKCLKTLLLTTESTKQYYEEEIPTLTTL